MKTAVLFGSSGLIGSNLLDNLINNNTYNKIKIFVRKLPSIDNSKVEVINTDFLDLDTLKEWPEKVKIMQSNWIGKSFGCEIDFKIEGSKKIDVIKCYTTRPDTLFGLSFIALSIDHPIAKYYSKDEKFLKYFMKLR